MGHKNKQSSKRALERNMFKKSELERAKKQLARYNEKYKEFVELPFEELILLKETKMSLTDFRALKQAIDDRLLLRQPHSD